MSTAETLLAQAIDAVNKGDLDTAADRFERAGATLGTINPRDAVSAYESAARLRLMQDDPRRAAESVARATKLEPTSARVARLHAEVVDHGGDLAARRTAWEAVVVAGDLSERQYAQLQLAAIERAAGQHGPAASYFEAALADLADDAPPGMRGELWLEIAIARTATQDRAGATAALAAAEATLSTSRGRTAAEAEADDEDQGLAGRILGQRGVLALDAGDLDGALRFGELARSSAVARNDVMTYLGASSLIAMVHEKADRLVAAYDTYIRARESLAQLVGEDGRAMIAPAVQLFEERLGPDKFKEVWDAWVAERRAAKA